jgi:hypothetical protein
MSDTLANALSSAGRSSSVLQGIANPAQLNPLAGMGTAMEMVGRMQGLDKSEAERRAGLALQGAINQQGEFDPNTARAGLAKDPATAYATGTTLSNIQNISSNQLEQARAKVNWTNNAAGSLTRLGPAITPQDALGVLRQGLTSGMLTQPEYDRQAAEVAGLGNDPAKLNAWANQHQFGAMSTAQQLEQTFGVPFKQTGPGGDTIGGTQNQRTGAVSGPAAQPGLPQGLGPEQNAAYQQWLLGTVDYPDPADPSKTKHGTRATFFQDNHIDPATTYPGALQRATGGSGGGGGGGSTTSTTRPGSGSPNKPAQQFGAGTGVKSLSAADLATQAEGVKSGTALMARADQVPTNRANFGTMLADAQKLDSMGASTERQTYLNSLSQKWLGTGLLGNASPEQIAAAESFAKIGNMIAGSQMAALGASDARQQLAIGSNPHLDLSKLGNQQIIHMLQGNEDAIEAKARAWKDWTSTHPAGSYGDFQNDLNKRFDVRVFQQRYMDQNEIGNLRKQLESQGTSAKFLQDVAYARKQGWIP